MKYTTILLITLSSLSFAGIYISYDVQATAELEVFGISVDNDYDTGALTLGYEDEVVHGIQTLPENILIGASFDVLKMKFGDNDSDVGDKCFSDQICQSGRWNHHSNVENVNKNSRGRAK